MKKKMWTLTGMPNARNTGTAQLIGSRIGPVHSVDQRTALSDRHGHPIIGRRSPAIEPPGGAAMAARDRPRRPQDPRRGGHDHHGRRPDHPPRRDPPPRGGRHPAGDRRRTTSACCATTGWWSARRCGSCRPGRWSRARSWSTPPGGNWLEETGYTAERWRYLRLPVRLAGGAGREAAPVRRGGADPRPEPAGGRRGTANR